MGLRKWLRESIFNWVRQDVAALLQEHEAELVVIFRDELRRLDDEIPEENLFIDIKMEPLGEAILHSALRAITRFLTAAPTATPAPTGSAPPRPKK
jgi:hypothetical protein